MSSQGWTPDQVERYLELGDRLVWAVELAILVLLGTWAIDALAAALAARGRARQAALELEQRREIAKAHNLTQLADTLTRKP